MNFIGNLLLFNTMTSCVLMATAAYLAGRGKPIDWPGIAMLIAVFCAYAIPPFLYHARHQIKLIETNKPVKGIVTTVLALVCSFVFLIGSVVELARSMYRGC